MKIERGPYSFSINSDWVAESGLKPFSKTSDHYLYKTTPNQAESIIVVRHEDIDPNIRKEGVPENLVALYGYVIKSEHSEDVRLEAEIARFT